MIRNFMAGTARHLQGDVVLDGPAVRPGRLVALDIPLGASHILHRTFETERILATLGDVGMTAMALAPTMSTNGLAGEGHDLQLSSLRTIVYGVRRIAPDRLARAAELFGDVLVQLTG